jgi:2-polyprenyl-3-methyl-5-hydroxy-6-metoxy-1,4-benzoquinol methylase
MTDTTIDYTRYYRHWHDGSDEHFASMAAAFANKLAPLLPAARGTRIIEVGCGMGFALGGLQKLGYASIKGIDSDRGQVAEATRRNLPVDLVPTNDTLSFLEGHREAFDVALCLDVLEHVPVAAQLSFLQAVRAALVPGGKFICQVPNANAAIANRFRYGDWTHHCSFSEHSLDFVLYNAGFIDIEIAEATPNIRPRLAFIPRRSVMIWMLRGAFRFVRRVQYMVDDLGWAAAKSIPLSPNIIATARRAQ